MNWYQVTHKSLIRRLLSDCWAVTLILVLLAALIPANAETPAPSVLRLPPCAKAPVMDGKMAPGEWDGAFMGCGILRCHYLSVGLMEVRKARYWLTYDNERVYVAMQTELPPWGTLDGKRRRIASEVNSDDELEIFIDPARPAGSIEESYYQLMGNWAGTMWNVTRNPKCPAAMSLNADVLFQNTVANGWWTAELSVRADELHKAQLIDGQTWGFDFTRYWQNPGGYSGWPSISYFSRERYLRVTLDKTAPVVQLLNLGDPQGGKPGFDFSFFNPGKKAVPLTVRMRVADRTTGAELKEVKQVTLAPGKKARVTWQTPWTISAKDNCMEAEVTSPDGKIRYFNTTLPFNKDNGRKTTWEAPPVKEVLPLDARVCFYPGVSRVRTLVNFSGMKAAAATITKATVVVKDPAGKELAHDSETKFEENEGEIVLQLPEKLAEGTYTVTVSLQAGDKPAGTPVQKTFEKKSFPFENNTIGISDKVLKPWTPMQADPEKKIVSCWNRQLTLTDTGFFAQVKTGAYDILARPVQLVSKSAGVNLPWRGDGVKFTNVAANAVDFTAAATCDKVKADIACHSEYDGMFKYTVTLTPRGDGKVDGLDLVVPIKEEYAWLLHGTSDGCRTNSSIFTPRGQGRVWDSLQVAQWRLTGTFIPYLWLGDDRSGLCWWADSEKGWVRPVSKKEPAVEVRRENGEVQMVFHIIGRPFQLTTPRTLVFAFTPTPARPRPSWARTWTMQSSKAEGYLKGPHIVQLGSCGWTTFDDETMTEYPYTYGRIRPVSDEADAFLKSAKSFAGRVKASGGAPIVYTDIFTRAVDRGGEVKYYASEWDRYSTPHPQEETAAWSNNASFSMTMSKSRLDYDLWCLKHDAELGIDGFYFDEVQVTGQCNPTAGIGVKLDDGSWESECSLFALRDYFKRLNTMLQEMGHDEPFIMPHSSSTMYAGSFAFATIPMDLEMASGDPDPNRGQIFGLGEAYAMCNVMGFNQGLAGSGMVCPAPLGQYSMGDTRMGRTFLGSMLLFDCHPIHGVPRTEGVLMDQILGDFGYDQPGVEYVPYWRATNLQTTGPDRVHVSLFRNQGKAMLVMYNDSPNPVNAKWRPTEQFGFTDSRLTLPRFYGLNTDPFYNYSKDVDGSWLTYIPPYDYRIAIATTNGAWGAKENWGSVDPKLFERNVTTVK